MKSTPKLLPLALMIAAGLATTACKKPEGATDAKATTAKTEAGDKAKTTIPGLATEKEQVSYMVGMDIAKTLEPAKDEIDLATVEKAMRTILKGEKSLMTDEQANDVRDVFAQKMQAKRIAEMMAAAKKNADEGQKFLAENGKKPDVKTTASGLQYQVITEGKGAKPSIKDAVAVKYKGTLLDGKEFDSTESNGGEPAVLPLERVIPGWSEGIQLMPVGSKYKFWIPSQLAYGDQVPPGAPIPPNATLVFEVELVDVVKPGQQPKPMIKGQ